MKSHIRLSKKQRDEIKDLVSQASMDCVLRTKADDIIALSECFGIGPARIKRYLEVLSKVTERSLEWIRDGVYDIKMREHFEQLGISYDDFMVNDFKFRDLKQMASKPQEISNYEKSKIVAKFDEDKQVIMNM